MKANDFVEDILSSFLSIIILIIFLALLILALPIIFVAYICQYIHGGYDGNTNL